MLITHTPAYRQAFLHYLRKGVTPETHPTPYYIWRTQSDGKTRPSHAANTNMLRY